MPKKISLWMYIVGIGIILIGLAGFFLYRMIIQMSPAALINSGVVQKYAGEDRDIFALVPRIMGFARPQTYLILFENNTEMRPSGGFIGAYAIARVDKGKIEVLTVEGSEQLDHRTPANWKPIPPKPLSDHLGVDRWYFRDSNWSPDFRVSAAKALELYRGEAGDKAIPVDGVVGITPTVIEALLRITGPITLEGKTFTADNVTETLEYEVEYGYSDRGIPFETRKQIMGPLIGEILHELKAHAFTDYRGFLDSMKQLAREKQIMMTSIDPELEKIIDEYGWSGKLMETNGDYLTWVDANLAALKTDHIMKRQLHYTITPTSTGQYIAVVSMEYDHPGHFDWRTSRYRTYARIFVPKGATLLSVDGAMVKDRDPRIGTADVGEENGKTWFGAFIAIEPQQKKTLTFTYQLPESVAMSIRNKSYHLMVQKQSGTKAEGLTLGLNFGTSIQTAVPAEEKTHWGDQTYFMQTMLDTDKEFTVGL